VCCSVLQCVAVCCSLLQCVAVCCRALQSFDTEYVSRVWVYCSESQCVVVCCSVWQCDAMCCSVCHGVAVRWHGIHVACCIKLRVLQCVAQFSAYNNVLSACCSVLQWIAACCSALTQNVCRLECNPKSKVWQHCTTLHHTALYCDQNCNTLHHTAPGTIRKS